MKQLKFNTNWNGKLNCNCFTTLRLHNPSKYKINQVLQIELQEKILYKAIVLGVKTCKLSEINDFMGFLDTGYSGIETQLVLKSMYPKIDFNTHLIDFVLLGRTPSQVKAISKAAVIYVPPIDDFGSIFMSA